ncbi:Zinc/iron permease [Clavulina sp. PMI_390]|nr:Zinc/iron permease [Clavulina sp. PMI_390]
MIETDSAPHQHSKIVGLLGILVAGLVAAYLPSASNNFSLIRLPSRTFFYAKHFGTGVILSTAITHLLNAAFDNLRHVRWLGYKHWPGLFVMMALLGIFYVEYVSNAYLARYHTKCQSDQDDVRLSKTLPSHSRPADERTSLLECGPSVKADVSWLKRQERILSVLILQIGIMLHSFVIGLTLAVASPARFQELLPAIFFHQVFEGVALGVRLASLQQPPEQDVSRPDSPFSSSTQSLSTTSFRPSRAERVLPPVLACFFAIPIPLILLVSLFIPALQSTTQPPSILSTVSASIQLAGRSQIMQGITSAVSAGLLIYASCVELLAADFVNNPDMQQETPSSQFGALLALTAGAAGMSMI